MISRDTVNKHYKLYKDGKFWVTALAGITFSMAAFSTPISADTIGGNQSSVSSSSSDKSIDEQKKSAKNIIDSEAIKISNNISNDKFLSQDDKDKQNNSVTEAATKAKNNIDQATNTAVVTDAKNVGITDVDNQYTPGKSDSSQDNSEAASSNQDTSNQDTGNKNSSEATSSNQDTSNQDTGNKNSSEATSSNQD
ncbi:DUF1542 domain-containing protein, partial [Leuconostoc mesenteroides]|uniref:DUF1542 domain-containing protein n=1 Tax=Leuconostoc mesenteroides TaxID=1245 RepID=UPI001B8D7CF8